MSAAKWMAGAMLLLASCQQRAAPEEGAGSTTPRYERASGEASPMAEAVRPVRIGELGPSFAACNALGTLRSRSGGAALAVRSAPFEAAPEMARVASGETFFVCSRSLDQKWLGIVHGGGVECGVSDPVAQRREYSGPCGSGWVSSAAVRLIGRPPAS